MKDKYWIMLCCKRDFTGEDFYSLIVTRPNPRMRRNGLPYLRDRFHCKTVWTREEFQKLSNVEINDGECKRVKVNITFDSQ